MAEKGRLIVIDPLFGEKPRINEKELAEIEKKWTTGINDIHQRDILDDNDPRNVICDLIHEVRVLRLRKDLQDDLSNEN